MQWRLLGGVPEAEVRELLAAARRRRFARNEVVFHRDDPGDALHLISSGRFAITLTTPVGDTVLLTIRGPGEHFGEMALVAGGPKRAATVQALEPAETLVLAQSAFARLRDRHPTVSDTVIALLAEDVRLMDARLLDALYCPADKRLLRRLDELAELYGGGNEVEIPLTQEQLAQLLCASRATVSQLLRDEERRGTLERRRRRTIVLDREQIARRAR